MDDGAPPPETALDVVGDPNRLAILRALYAAEGGPVSFTSLQDATGMRDSGLFNYHLGRLVGPFVSKSEAGYELRYAGEQVVGAVLAGTYTDDRALGPVPVGVACHDCDGELDASYAADHGTVACRECETVLTRFRMPPGLFDSESQLPHTMDRWVRLETAHATSGICPACLGPTTLALRLESDDPYTPEMGPVATFTCERCGRRGGGGVGMALLDHPAVVAFHHDHGVDLRETLVWEHEWLLSTESVVVSEEPPRVRLTIEQDDETLSVTLDEVLTVVELERRAR